MFHPENYFSMEEISDWGVPDWREADQYPATDSLTHRQWRWQFLRRRPEFRAEWQAGVHAGKIWFDTVLTGDPDRCKREYGIPTVIDPEIWSCRACGWRDRRSSAQGERYRPKGLYLIDPRQRTASAQGDRGISQDDFGQG